MTPVTRHNRIRFGAMLAVAMTAVASCGSCGKKVGDGSDEIISKAGTIEVTAKLEEIRFPDDGKFPSNDLYDYVYIMKYQVLETHRGTVKGESILVGHYNPLKPRAKAADARADGIGGKLEKFRVSDIHRLALDVPLDEHYMGPIINKYHGEGKAMLHWAVWTNRVVR